MSITYVKGDATKPIGLGPKIIAHICNDRGGWGAGFSGSISRRWREPEARYRADFAAGRLWLGSAQLIIVDKDLYVLNMVAQNGYSTPGRPAIDYESLPSCLGTLAACAETLKASVHMPRIGCGLAGGLWEIIGPLVDRWLGMHLVYVYDFGD